MAWDPAGGAAEKSPFVINENVLGSSLPHGAGPCKWPCPEKSSLFLFNLLLHLVLLLLLAFCFLSIYGTTLTVNFPAATLYLFHPLLVNRSLAPVGLLSSSSSSSKYLQGRRQVLSEGKQNKTVTTRIYTI